MSNPAGVFMMGSNDGNRDEQPVHQVELPSYYMDMYEATNEQYKVCVSAGECTVAQIPGGSGGSYTRETYLYNSEFSNYPVINVDWEMATTYCKWRGGHLRLRQNGKSRARHRWSYLTVGNDIDCNRANYSDCSGKIYRDTTAVGVFENGKSIYGFTIWQAMCGNGYLIGMTPIIIQASGKVPNNPRDL